MSAPCVFIAVHPSKATLYFDNENLSWVEELGEATVWASKKSAELRRLRGCDFPGVREGYGIETREVNN